MAAMMLDLTSLVPSKSIGIAGIAAVQPGLPGQADENIDHGEPAEPKRARPRRRVLKVPACDLISARKVVKLAKRATDDGTTQDLTF